MKYKRRMFVPPPFKYFEEAGRGYPSLADLAVSVGIHEAAVARHEITEYITKGETPPSETLRILYACWTEAEEVLLKLSYMSEEDREKHLKLDAKAHAEKLAVDLDKVRERHAELTAAIEQLEEQFTDLCWIAMLDESLLYSLDLFLGFLAKEKEYGLHYEDEDRGYSDYMESVEDVCGYRDGLEYAKIGVGILRDRGRLQTMKKYEEFKERLDASDELFKYVLRGKLGYRFSTDPTFWWHRHYDSPEQDAMLIDPPKDSRPRR